MSSSNSFSSAGSNRTKREKLITSVYKTQMMLHLNYFTLTGKYLVYEHITLKDIDRPPS